MNMGMVQQVLAPSMQDSEETDLSAKAPWIGRDLQQRLGNCAEE